MRGSSMWQVFALFVFCSLDGVFGAAEEPSPIDQYTDSGETIRDVGGNLLPASTFRQLLESSAVDSNDLDKRTNAWNKLNMGFSGKRSDWNKLNMGFSGKRASDWNRLSGVWGKRSLDTTSSIIGFDGDGSTNARWNQLNQLWGKRTPGSPTWNNLNHMWGKRGWNDMKGEWGKRASPHWNNLRGMWGRK